MEERVYVLLVIYDQNGGDSAACRALREMGHPRVLLVDNSPTDRGNAAYCADAGWDYLSMNGNAGLPKAYNRGIAFLKGKADVVVLLDDDTTLDASYFAALREARKARPDGRVFFPSVYDRAGLLSPCRTRGFGFQRAEAASDIPPEALTAINSGLAIDMAVFDSYRYDERFFLDFVDHAFMRDMRRRGVPLVPIDATLSQQFSGSEAYDAARARPRFARFKKDARVYYSDSLTGRLYYPLCLCRRWISLKRQAFRAR